MMEQTQRLQDAIGYGGAMAVDLRVEFITPEVLLLGICCANKEFRQLCKNYHVDPQKDIKEPICLNLGDIVPEEVEDYEWGYSQQFMQVLYKAELETLNACKDKVDVPHVLHAILHLPDSFANYLLRTKFTDNEGELMRSILDVYDEKKPKKHHSDASSEDELDDLHDDMFAFDDMGMDMDEPKWEALTVCINDRLAQHNPLVGREKELDRTIEILCRKDKNNPLHVGEPGVGKTALIYGLAQRIENGEVPSRLKGAKIYQIDMGSLVAGTRYRGDFEERLVMIMEGVRKQGNAIVYIDEIHTLIGSGSTSEGSLDGANMLKPYLESGEIRFIGATTYKEYDRYFKKSQGIVRRFQKIDVEEPSKEDTISILEGLKSRYEKYHKVQYRKDLIPYVVELCAKYLTDRFFPDKAIDILDEAGAYCEMHRSKTERQVVTKAMVTEIVKKVGKLSDDMMAGADNTVDTLALLQKHLTAQIFGQEKAVEQVVEAVYMAKSGLNEMDKPLASLLFVGPTGVGKTELCRVLAKELGVELVRFDMSEYAEKHSVAKLIGSPAGYVGYEDGGLLTSAIRKAPNCVLLLDEIEKAHEDIYNILLQVMDYARLTDNQGNKVDFRNVILIMTSNAGAQFASSGIGFDNTISRGGAMLQTVKKTFKPEFINRLTATVVFNDMTREMAARILDKKIVQLSAKLESKQVELVLSEEARELLLDKGFTAQYGAREMNRVVDRLLTSELVKEILFGKLRKGGIAKVERQGDSLKI